jgi:tetratricopeptide (TPR) repeat protein
MERSEDYRVALGLGETVERRGLAQAEAAAGVRTGARFTEHPDPEARADELDEEATSAWREAIELYKEALALAPADGEVLNGLVRAHTLLEENDAALSWGGKVIEVTSSDRAWWTEALKRPGMSPREEAACRRSIDQLDRLEASVHLNSYSILAATEDLNSALEHLESAATLNPSDSTIHSRRAELLVELGRHAEALNSIDSFLSSTDKAFDSQDVRRAFRLRAACQAAIDAKEG